MKLVTQDAILYGRFALVQVAVFIASAFLTLVSKLLPQGHPSRVYISGRVRCGRANMMSALRAPRKHA